MVGEEQGQAAAPHSYAQHPQPLLLLCCLRPFCLLLPAGALALGRQQALQAQQRSRHGGRGFQVLLS